MIPETELLFGGEGGESAHTQKFIYQIDISNAEVNYMYKTQPPLHGVEREEERNGDLDNE